MLAGCQQRVGISSPSLADSPVAKLLPGPCVLEDGRIQCFDDDSTLAREHAVVDAKVGYDTICTLYQDRRLACTGLFGSQVRRREFAGVDEFALGFNNLCILDRAVGVRCIDAPTWSGTGSVLHPDLLSASQLVAFGGGLVCALLEGDELRCKDIGDPERTLYQRDGVIQIASGDDVACLREHDGTVWCWGEPLGAPEANSWTSIPSPRQVPGLPAVVDIAVGESHACARDQGDRVWCWGAGENGQLGRGMKVMFSATAEPVWPPLRASALRLVDDTSYALAVDERGVEALRVWGSLDSGESSFSVGDGYRPGRARFGVAEHDACSDIDLDQWARDYSRIDPGVQFSVHLARLRMFTRSSDEPFATELVDRKVAIHEAELDGVAPSERVVVATIADARNSYLSVRVLSRPEQGDAGWCIGSGEIDLQTHGSEQGLDAAAARALAAEGRSLPSTFEIEFPELFGPGHQSILVREVHGNYVFVSLYGLDERLRAQLYRFEEFSFRDHEGATFGRLEMTGDYPRQIVATRRQDCRWSSSPTNCEPQQWRDVLRYEHGFYVEVERSYRRGSGSDRAREILERVDGLPLGEHFE